MNKKLILQRLLNMRRDLRVILVGNEIILHYWRINLSDEWKPTSTGFGSQVDFENFPENWRSWIIDSFNKLKISLYQDRRTKDKRSVMLIGLRLFLCRKKSILAG